jgi:hypothetical protein
MVDQLNLHSHISRTTNVHAEAGVLVMLVTDLPSADFPCE